MTEKVGVFFLAFIFAESVFHLLRTVAWSISSTVMYERSLFPGLPLFKLCSSVFPSLDPTGTERCHVLLYGVVHSKIRYHGSIHG